MNSKHSCELKIIKVLKLEVCTGVHIPQSDWVVAVAA